MRTCLVSFLLLVLCGICSGVEYGPQEEVGYFQYLKADNIDGLAWHASWQDILDGTTTALANVRTIRDQLGRPYINVKTDYGATGDGVTDVTAAMTNAEAAADDAGGDMFFPPGTYLLDADLTISANVRLVFAPGAKIKIATTRTLTITGMIEAPLTQIFEYAGTGKVLLDLDTGWCQPKGLLREIYPQWWGAVGDGDAAKATANKNAINAAIAAAFSGYELVFVPGKYKIDGPILPAGSGGRPNGICLRGNGMNPVSTCLMSSWIYGTDPNQDLIDYTGSASLIVDGLTFSYHDPGFGPPAAGTGAAINIRGLGGSGHYIRNCWFTHGPYAAIRADQGDVHVENCLIELYNYGTGILNDGTAFFHVYDSRIYGCNVAIDANTAGTGGIFQDNTIAMCNYGIVIDGGPNYMIQNNQIGPIYTGNAIALNGVWISQITNNRIDTAKGNGIYLTNGRLNQVSGNFIGGFDSSDQSLYSGIYLDGNESEDTIDGNFGLQLANGTVANHYAIGAGGTATWGLYGVYLNSAYSNYIGYNELRGKSGYVYRKTGIQNRYLTGVTTGTGGAYFADSGETLLTNGDMELDSEWVSNGTPTTQERSITQAHAGTYSRKFTVNYQYQGVKSAANKSLLAGHAYELVVWIYPDDTTSVAYALYSSTPPAYLLNSTATGLTQDAWNEFRLIFIASTTTTSAEIAFYSGAGVSAGTWYIDDMSIKEIPLTVGGPLAVNGDMYTTGDLRVLGDDIFATTNTIGALWVGDGTNYNPVVMGGNATIAANGTVSLADDCVAAAEMADADHGDVAWSGGVASVQAVAADAITSAMIGDSQAVRLLGSGTAGMQAGDAKTTIYTVPAGKSAIVTMVIVRNPTASLANGVDYDLGDGANADTWKVNNDLSGMTAATDCIVITNDNAKFTVFDATDAFGIKPGTGATADAEATVMVYGIEF